MSPIDILPFLVNAVPAAHWVTIGHYATYLIFLMCGLYGALFVLNKIDLRDGKLDHPKLVEALEALRVLLSYFVACLELLPLPRLPLIDGLRRFKSLNERGPR